jgi:hypothetical protein
VEGTLAFVDDASKVVITGTLTSVGAGAKFRAKAGATDGAGIKLTVAATSDLKTATGFTSPNVTAPDAVVITSAGAGGGTGVAYVIGDASFALNNASTALTVDGVTSSAGTATDDGGGITAASGTAVILAGST